MESTRTTTKQAGTAPDQAARKRGLLRVYGLWLLLLAALAFYLALAIPYIIDRFERPGLEERLAAAQTTLQRIKEPDLPGLNAQLAAAKADYERLQAAAKAPVIETELGPRLEALAQRNGALLTSMDVQASGSETENGLIYTVYRFALTASGSLQGLAGFVQAMETESGLGLRVQKTDLRAATGEGQSTLSVTVSAYRVSGTVPTPTPAPTASGTGG